MMRAVRVVRALGLSFVVALLLAGAPAAVVAADHASGPAHGEEHPAKSAAEGHEGAHGGEHAPSIDGKTLGLQLLNFGVLLFILIKFGGGAINKALLARHQQLKTDLAAAAEARTQAEERLKKQEQRMANLEKEIHAIRLGIKQEAEAEKARLIAAAEERARRIREETAFIIEQQVKEAEALLRREASDGAVKIAEELLRRAMDARDQQRFVETFVADVAAERPAPPRDGGARPPVTPRNVV
jgi:F-type H+-transporting ATPase subunit b